MQRKQDAFLNTTYKNLKQSKNLNIRSKTIKLLEENIRISLLNIGFDRHFLGVISKAQKTKSKIKNKWDYIELKSFCTGKIKKKPMEWEKIFVNLIW